MAMNLLTLFSLTGMDNYQGPASLSVIAVTI